MEVKVDSSESEGIYENHLSDKLDEILEDALEQGLDPDGDNVTIDAGNIIAPTFVYDNEGGGAAAGNQGPGTGGSGGVKFTIPLEKFMDMVAKRLDLPNLLKEGKGKIKEIAHEYKTFGNTGIILDKKRTFKQALKTSIGTGVYKPSEDKYEVNIRKKDKRFKLPEKVEKDKFKAVVFFGADISYSTYGERLKLEKKYINFIKCWLDYNYGLGNVEYRFFVHDADAYEVDESNFFKVDNEGGTQVFPMFDLLNDISLTEYSPSTTNMYFFYFGDGELFSHDVEQIEKILWDMSKNFCRIGITEVLPSNYSKLVADLTDFTAENVKLVKATNKKSNIITNIKKLFK
jgi:uncharacterized sporulation protein YeaH/YhbH (DUF444 family)